MELPVRSTNVQPGCVRARNVGLYPSGHLYRTRYEDLRGNLSRSSGYGRRFPGYASWRCACAASGGVVSAGRGEGNRMWARL